MVHLVSGLLQRKFLGNVQGFGIGQRMPFRNLLLLDILRRVLLVLALNSFRRTSGGSLTLSPDSIETTKLRTGLPMYAFGYLKTANVHGRIFSNDNVYCLFLSLIQELS